jgi:hypothetical protein
MKLFSTTFLLMLIIPFGFGQTNDSYAFAGVLTTSDGQVMSFKLVVNELNEGRFKGYSATNYEGNDYTKSIVEGKLDLKEKKMSFKEISNTETTSTAEDSTFCYISASNLTIEISDKKNIIKGKFEGLFPSGKICATGALVLINKDVLDKIVIENKPKQNTPVSSTSEIKASTVTDSIFTSNEVLLINEWKNGLTLEVWDGDLQDNDEIAIYLNNVLKRNKIVLMHKKTIIDLPPNNQNFKIKIVALNEGRSGKNTINFKLKNAGTGKDYVCELKKGESFIIDFKKH